MQISNSFDPETIAKIKRSALLSLAGFAVAVLPMIAPPLMEMAKGNPVIVALISAGVPFLLNTLKNYLAGK